MRAIHPAFISSLLVDIAGARPDSASWVHICDSLARAAGGIGTVFVPFEPKLRSRGLLASQSLEPSLRLYLKDGWHLNDYRQIGTGMLIERGYVLDTEIYSIQQIETLPYYQKFLVPLGLGGFCGLHFRVGDSDWSASIQLPLGQFSPSVAFMAAIPDIRATLNESSNRCAREVEQTWRTYSDTFAHVGIGCVAIDSQGVALEVSAMAAEHLNKANIVWDVGQPPPSQTMIGDPPWLNGGLGPFPRQVAMVADGPMSRSGISAVFASLPPILDFFARPARGLVLLQITGRSLPPVQKVVERFSLTKTEASIVECLAFGLTVSEAAKANKVTVGTLRQQLKSIYRKTNVGSQHQLVALIYQ